MRKICADGGRVRDAGGVQACAARSDVVGDRPDHVAPEAEAEDDQAGDSRSDDDDVN